MLFFLFFRFWDISSHIIISIAIQLIGHKSGNASVALDWLQRLLQQRNLYLKQHKDKAWVGSGTEIHRQTRNKLEVVLLTSMCSIEPSVVSTAAHCFNMLCEEADILRMSGGQIAQSSRTTRAARSGAN